MAYKFRTTGPWGPGTSTDLDPVDVDGNFWQAIQDIQDKAVQGVGIADVIVTGNQFSFVLTDHTVLGPYDLPMMQILFRGEWAPTTFYAAGSIITHSGSTYFVQQNHTSAATFDPGANDGFGHDFYGLLLTNPALAIPTGGAVGAFLRKVTSADYVMQWQTAALTDLSDVTLPVSPGPVTGDVLRFSGGIWTNAAFVPPITTLAGLDDVLQSPSPSTGDLVYWNGSVFAYISPSSLPSGIPFIDAGNKSGSFTLDLSTSSTRFTMTANCTVSSFTWPSATGLLVRRVVQVVNSGSFTLTWPSASKWPGGTKPAQTVSGTDTYVLFTTDSGSNVYGNVVGQNYS